MFNINAICNVLFFIYIPIINAAFDESVEESSPIERPPAEHYIRASFPIILSVNCFGSNVHPQFLTTTATLQFYSRDPWHTIGLSARGPLTHPQRHFKHWIQKDSKILLYFMNWKVSRVYFEYYRHYHSTWMVNAFASFISITIQLGWLYVLNIISITIQLGWLCFEYYQAQHNHSTWMVILNACYTRLY